MTARIGGLVLTGLGFIVFPILDVALVIIFLVRSFIPEGSDS